MSSTGAHAPLHLGHRRRRFLFLRVGREGARDGVVEPGAMGRSAVGGARIAICANVRIVKAHVEDGAEVGVRMHCTM